MQQLVSQASSCNYHYTRNSEQIERQLKAKLTLQRPDQQVQSHGAICTLQFAGQFLLLLRNDAVKIGLIPKICSPVEDLYKSGRFSSTHTLSLSNWTKLVRLIDTCKLTFKQIILKNIIRSHGLLDIYLQCTTSGP